MTRRKGGPRLSPKELERMRNDSRRVHRDTFRPAPGRSVTPIPEGVVIPPAGSGRNFSSNPASIRPSPSNPKRPERPGIKFEIGGGLVGSRFPDYTQPGGGFEIGRPAVGYDRPGRGRTLDGYQELPGRPSGIRDKARRDWAGRKFEGMLRARMGKF